MRTRCPTTDWFGRSRKDSGTKYSSGKRERCRQLLVGECLISIVIDVVDETPASVCYLQYNGEEMMAFGPSGCLTDTM